MTPAEYRRLREKIGSQDTASKILDVTVASVARRESGTQRIRREAEFALRWAVQEEKRHPSPKVTRLRSTPNGRPSPSTKKRKADRKASEFARCFHSEERVEFVKRLRCVVPGCLDRRIENCHAVGGGTSRKAGYEEIYPGCHGHHKEEHRIGKRSFEKKYGIDLRAEARGTEASWRMHENALTGEA